MDAPDWVLTDIEGTTAPIDFVHEVLFPFARERLAGLIAARAEAPEVAAALAEVGRLAPGRPVLPVLFEWMDADAKIGPLKQLQGIIWREGYRAGVLRGAIYPDVAPALRAWAGAGVRLAVYSSGSEEAQRLIFGHSEAGDLSGLFSAYFDTRVGAKRERQSYGAIARALSAAPGRILFLSDVGAELDAAAAAGLLTCQLVRPRDGTKPAAGHRQAADFAAVARLFGLPEGRIG
jgi:enolase-phosphatase E1